MKILSNKKYNELILKSCRGMFGAVTDDMLLRSNALYGKENEELQQRMDKAIEYNKENKKFANEVENEYAEEICKNNLEILGDKE